MSIKVDSLDVDRLSRVGSVFFAGSTDLVCGHSRQTAASATSSINLEVLAL